MKTRGRQKFEMKSSSLAICGLIPTHWNEKKLKKIADIRVSNVDKKEYDGEKKVFLCNYVDVYKNEEINSKLNFMKATASANQIDRFSLKKEDVIITKDSEEAVDIAIPSIVTEDLPGVVCGYHLAVIRASKKILGKYLKLQFQTKPINDQFVVSANGVTRFGLNTSAILNSIFLLPSTAEQDKISGFLESVNFRIKKLIEIKSKQIELLREHEKSLIHHAVTKGLDPKAKMKDSGVDWMGVSPAHWVMCRLKERVDLDSESINESSGSDLLIKYLDITAVESTGLVKEPVELAFSDAPSRARRIIHDGDTIFSTVRPNLQALAFFENVEPNLIASTGFCTLSPNGNLEPKYLFYFVKSDYFMNFAFSRSVGVSYPAVGRKDLAVMPFLLPPAVEQKQIVEFLEKNITKIQSAIKKIELEIAKLEEYKKSLIYEVVTGKVEVLA